MAEQMNAVVYDACGASAANLKHVQVPIPSPKRGEILIKVEATSINPTDWMIQDGVLLPHIPPTFPHIPGTDVAGEVVKVGQGVYNVKAGDKVVALLTQTRGGGLAQYAVSTDALTVKRPSEVSADVGAGLPTAGLTALQALKKAEITLHPLGDFINILITAAGGGVGHYAVQLAKLGNVHVTATCGSTNIPFVKSLGADEVLDYATDGASLKNSSSDRKYDVVINCAKDISFSKFKQVLSDNGKWIEVTPSLTSILNSVFRKWTLRKQKLMVFLLEPKVDDLQHLVRLASEGLIKTHVDKSYTLSNVGDAWARSMGGHVSGKLIVEM